MYTPIVHSFEQSLFHNYPFKNVAKALHILLIFSLIDSNDSRNQIYLNIIQGYWLYFIHFSFFDRNKNISKRNSVLENQISNQLFY